MNQDYQTAPEAFAAEWPRLVIIEHRRTLRRWNGTDSACSAVESVGFLFSTMLWKQKRQGVELLCDVGAGDWDVDIIQPNTVGF